jgi:4-diphosphocytidyl-2-C-methyl-D-erythritol kinase
VDKQLPWGAGLGGGSSDAASTLLALNWLWGLHWPRERLLGLGATLGADVPFFIGGRNAFVEGIGDRLTPVALPPQRFAVVKPAAAIATADIFRSPELVRDTEPVILTGSFASAGFGDGFGRNDLQPVAEARCPEVRVVAEWLHSRFGNSRMTGSGSAVFARVGVEDRSLATWPPQSLPGPWIARLCRSLDHHPLMGWAG